MHILERIMKQTPNWADKVYVSKSLYKKLGLANLGNLTVHINLCLSGQTFAFGQTLPQSK